MTVRSSTTDAGERPRRCLTEFSIPALVAGAAALSAVLWLAIYAVI